MIEPELMVPQISNVGLVARYKLQYAPMNATTVFDYTFSEIPGTITGSNIAPVFPGFSFNGSDDFIDVGNQGSSIKSMAMWVKILTADNDEYPLDLNGTAFISIINGEITDNGMGVGVVLYVDGVVGVTVTAGIWHLIVITLSTGVTASDMDIGRLEGTGFFDGSIGETLLFDITLNAPQVRSIYELTRAIYGR